MGEFKVLSIDGGGIRGLYSACVLAEFERRLRRDHGDDARIVDVVDLVCGTSTGGLIALAISVRASMDEICQFYTEDGARIFKSSRDVRSYARQIIGGGKYSDKTLREALTRFFRDRTLADSQCFLCIPVFDFTHGTYEVFKRDHAEGDLSRHNEIPMVEAALATCAAPTYFPIAEIRQAQRTQYVDGGVWANNPSMVGLTEAMWHFVGAKRKFERVRIVSLASLSAVPGKPPLMRRARGLLRWSPDLFEMGMIAQSEFADVFLTTMARSGSLPLTYVRIPSPPVGGSHRAFTRLDSADARSMALMRQLGVEVYHRTRADPEVLRFFARREAERV